MHAWRICDDRTTALAEFWPPDFDPADIDLFAACPPAPEVVECRICARRGMCRPGHWAKPQCRERDTTPALRLPMTRNRTDESRAKLIAVLQDGPLTIAGIVHATGWSYSQARRMVDALRAEQPPTVYVAGKVQGRGRGDQPSLYGLTEGVTTPTVAYTLYPCHQKILDCLRQYGEQGCTDIAERVGTSRHAARVELGQLMAAGLVANRTVPNGSKWGDRKKYRAL